MKFFRSYLPAIIWMTVIFIGSTDLGSSQRTSRLIGPFLRWLNPDVSEETIRAVQMVVRKGMHMFVYGVLALLTWCGRRANRGLGLTQAPWSWPEMWGVVAFCIAYAMSDELHQSFVASRQGSPYDVGFDTAGAILALLAVFAMGRWPKRW